MVGGRCFQEFCMFFGRCSVFIFGNGRCLVDRGRWSVVLYHALLDHMKS